MEAPKKVLDELMNKEITIEKNLEARLYLLNTLRDDIDLIKIQIYEEDLELPRD